MQTSQSAVARLESGQHDAQLSTLTRYAEALGLSLDFIADTGTQAEGSSEDPGAGAAETAPAGQVPGEKPHADAGLKGRPERKPEEGVPAGATTTPDRPDPDHVLTWRQRKVLQVIRDSVQKRGYPPSMREIAEAVGLTSTASVSHQLRTLQRKGYLHRDVGRPRTVEVCPAGDPAAPPVHGGDQDETPGIPRIDIPVQEVAHVPLLGRIAAGGPILAEQYVEDILPLPKQLVGEGPVFLLEVTDDSMIGAAIKDGDWVVVRQQSRARDGDLVAVDIDGVATVRTYLHSEGNFWLIPNNPGYKAASADKAYILGLVVSVVRQVFRPLEGRSV